MNKQSQRYVNNIDNWSNFKVLMRHLGIDCGFCRTPYGPLSAAQVRERLAAFAKPGIVEKNYACSHGHKMARDTTIA